MLRCARSGARPRAPAGHAAIDSPTCTTSLLSPASAACVATDLLRCDQRSRGPGLHAASGPCADFEGASGLRPLRRRTAGSRCPRPCPAAGAAPAAGDWTRSLDRAAYTAGVRRIREHIAAGDVYQANLCRVLSAPLPDPGRADVDALTALLARGNPAPYAGTIRLPGARRGDRHRLARAVSAARRPDRRVRPDQGHRPHRGGPAGEGPRRERDDRGPGPQRPRPGLRHRLASPSPTLCAVEKHPGLVHLVSTVRGELRDGAGWPELLGATFPPGSVTGAPKSSALRIIDELETAPRGPYCGGIGWVDADRGTGELAVGIRTFWIDRTPPAARCCASAPAPASPGAPTRSGSGRRPS